MDVDIIFRRGYAYTLATLCVLAAFYAIVFSLVSLVQVSFKDLGNTGLVIVMLIATFLFQPIRNWIQEQLDRYFYRDRYDYRRTLIEFARELNSEADLDTMLQSVARPADADAFDAARGVFPGGAKARRRRFRRSGSRFRLRQAMGSEPRRPAPATRTLDLEFSGLAAARALSVLRAHPLSSGRGCAAHGPLRCGRPLPIWT